MFKQSKQLALLLTLCLVPAFAGTGRYRAMWRDNPATTMVIGWDQQSGSSPVLYYDTVDHGTNTGSYAYQQTPDRSVSYKGMSNQFVRLTGLQADTVYYFVIADSTSTSARMKFRTAADDQSPFTLIAGGDSRNNWDVRIDANKMVAKLKPLFVMFGGDMTSGDSNSEWQTWMDHWQDTITSDGRLIPIVAARGNHEGSNASITNLFDSPNSSVYFALTFGDDLLRTYTLNSEDVEGGNQASWLQSDLSANQQVNWRFAQYHKPMRPHVSSKSEGNSEYNAWAQHFYDYKMQLVVECDSHMVKSTWPVRPYSGSGSDEGFIRDDENGTVYVGEGTWGAPLRSADDNKTWTRESGSFNQFKWLQVTPSQVQVKTVQYGNVDSVGEVSQTNSFTPPSGIQFWGATLLLSAATAPSVSITNPTNGTLYNDGDTVNIGADASSPSGSIQSVRFEVDGNTIATDSSVPYSASWTASGSGNHTITAVATDDVGETAQDSISVQVGVATITQRVASSSDDAEEENGGMYLDSSDLELIRESAEQIVGIRFIDLPIPQGATITAATIQFTCDETTSESTDLVIQAQDSGDTTTFTSSNNNISNRPLTSALVNWSPAAWNSVGEAGSAQRTPDLSSLVQEVVDRGDWASGNAMVFIFDGTGRRTAEAYDGVSTSAPLLSVTFTSGGGGPTNTPPTAGFSHTTADLTANFTDTSSDSDGSIASRSWNFGDGNTSSAQNPSHTYASAGSYTVSLTVTDNEGASDSTSASVTVSEANAPELENGVPVSGLVATTGNWLQFYIDVPANATNLTLTTSGGSGDADLYVRQGAEPNSSDYDCRSNGSSNAEDCSFTNPAQARWYVGVYAYSTVSGLTLTASYTTGGSGGCEGNSDASDISASKSQWQYFSLDVSSCATTLTATISGGSGDADLYLRQGSQPTTSSYSCRPYKWGNEESCTVDNPAEATWYVGIRAYEAYSGVNLTFNYQ